MSGSKDTIHLGDGASASLIAGAAAGEPFSLPKAVFTTTCWRVLPAFRRRAEWLSAWLRALMWLRLGWLGAPVERALRMLPRELVWEDISHNVVTTAGKNSVLDVYFRAATQITSWFCGLISSVSYTAVAAGDTAAQINGTNGWREAGGANAPTYSGARKALTFGNPASAGSLSTSAASSFTFTGTGTIKGMFAVSTSTVDGTTGTLYNAVLFNAPGDRAVANTDIVNVNVTYTA